MLLPDAERKLSTCLTNIGGGNAGEDGRWTLGRSILVTPVTLVIDRVEKYSFIQLIDPVFTQLTRSLAKFNQVSS